jgi:hypothetical protein
MVLRGEVAIAGRQGRGRPWDLALRVYPDDPVVPADEALRIRNERRLQCDVSTEPGAVQPRNKISQTQTDTHTRLRAVRGGLPGEIESSKTSERAGRTEM